MASKLQMDKLIYERLLKTGLDPDACKKLATPPQNAEMQVWGVVYENGWPDVSMSMAVRRRGSICALPKETWQQAYHHVLDLRDVIMVMYS